MRHGIAYTTNEAEGAWPNGSFVRKANSQPGDGTADGVVGQVVGSLDARSVGPWAAFAYFVRWPHFPHPVFCVDTNRDGTPRLELVVQ